MPTWLFTLPLIELQPQKARAKIAGPKLQTNFDRPARPAGAVVASAQTARDRRKSGTDIAPCGGARIETPGLGEMVILGQRFESEGCGRLATGKICRKAISAKTGGN